MYIFDNVHYAAVKTASLFIGKHLGWSLMHVAAPSEFDLGFDIIAYDDSNNAYVMVNVAAAEVDSSFDAKSQFDELSDLRKPSRPDFENLIISLAFNDVFEPNCSIVYGSFCLLYDDKAANPDKALVRFAVDGYDG